jgi:hypothetical protein
MSRRWTRPLFVGLTAVLLAITLVETWWLWQYIGAQHALGADHAYYVSIAQRWLDTGVWYTDRQLAGPYEQTTLVDNLYPPHALYLFLPFVWLPGIVWWLVPAALLGYAIWRLRPAIWSWPILALLIALPKTPNAILYGNSDLWVMGFVAAAVVWGWPAVFVTFKPSMGMFALIGIHRRDWWIALGVLGLATLPQLALWREWPVAVDNSTATVGYSFAAIPFILVPIVVRLASTTRPRVGLPSLPWARTIGSRVAPKAR